MAESREIVVENVKAAKVTIVPLFIHDRIVQGHKRTFTKERTSLGGQHGRRSEPADVLGLALVCLRG